MMNPFYRLVFDNARGRIGKIAASTLIGATVALLAAVKHAEMRKYWVEVTIGGAGLGLLAALILVMVDARAAAPDRAKGRYGAVAIMLLAGVALVCLTACLWSVFL
jgi:hypothetical protein